VKSLTSFKNNDRSCTAKYLLPIASAFAKATGGEKIAPLLSVEKSYDARIEAFHVSRLPFHD
jgi:hypothetical protein